MYFVRNFTLKLEKFGQNPKKIYNKEDGFYSLGKAHFLIERSIT
jgi:hypothetical protein